MNDIVLALGKAIHTVLGSKFGDLIGIGLVFSTVGASVFKLIRGNFSAANIDTSIGALAEGQERTRRRKLRQLSYVQIATSVPWFVAAVYVYVVAPLKEVDPPPPDWMQSVAFCVLAASLIVILLAAVAKLFLTPNKD